MTLPHTDETASGELPEAARALLGQVADKWSILILMRLCDGPLRFNALRRSLGGITQTSLTQALRRLERNGIVERRILPGSPPAVEYRGTALGFSLGPAMRVLFSWSMEHRAEVRRAQRAYDIRLEL